jgi:hypothetical protein
MLCRRFKTTTHSGTGRPAVSAEAGQGYHPPIPAGVTARPCTRPGLTTGNNNGKHCNIGLSAGCQRLHSGFVPSALPPDTNPFQRHYKSTGGNRLKSWVRHGPVPIRAQIPSASGCTVAFLGCSQQTRGRSPQRITTGERPCGPSIQEPEYCHGHPTEQEQHPR